MKQIQSFSLKSEKKTHSFQFLIQLRPQPICVPWSPEECTKQLFQYELYLPNQSEAMRLGVGSSSCTLMAESLGLPQPSVLQTRLEGPLRFGPLSFQHFLSQFLPLQIFSPHFPTPRFCLTSSASKTGQAFGHLGFCSAWAERNSHKFFRVTRACSQPSCPF